MTKTLNCICVSVAPGSKVAERSRLSLSTLVMLDRDSPMIVTGVYPPGVPPGYRTCSTRGGLLEFLSPRGGNPETPCEAIKTVVAAVSEPEVAVT